MGEDDAGAAMLAASAMISPAGNRAPVSSPDGARRWRQRARVVDMGDPQAFPRRVGVGEAAGEKSLGRGEAVELQREFGTLIPHAP